MSSDDRVFYQVFAQCDYACFNDLTNVSLIIDCGANVGYTSAYFLSRHPKASVIAVEPDQANFELLEQNLSLFHSRFRVVQKGIWSYACDLTVVRPRPGDRNEWGVQVRETRDGEQPDVSAVDIQTLLRESGHSRISILKIDIEGSEAELLRHGCDWLDLVDNLAIELHGADCERLFCNGRRRKGLSNFALRRADRMQNTVPEVVLF